MAHFLLNDQIVSLDQVTADTTVLDLVREQHELWGTKEGCASGDCGACTVTVVDEKNGKLVYESANSCIMLAGALKGKQLITVDHLKENQRLHPVQQSLVDHHASQCGFCTPGFVMSLFTLYKNGPTDSHQNTTALVHENLAGNLCRCTGYRPIVDAANSVLGKIETDQFDDREGHTLSVLESLKASENSQQPGFLIPDSISQLIQDLENHPDARLLAGGTDLVLEVTQQLKSLHKVILLKNVKELSEVMETTEQITIGAAVSLNQCYDILKDHYPSMAEMLHRFGSKQVRNQGTIGGNIANASPIGDLPPVLITLGAQLNLQDKDNIRTIEIEDFFLDYRKTDLRPGEFIRSIVIPKLRADQHFRVYKVSKRLDDDISAVCIAIKLHKNADSEAIESVRIAFGGMAAIPKRAGQCESVLMNEGLTGTAIENAINALQADFDPISDARASAQYRIQVAGNLLKRFVLDIESDHDLLQVGDI